MMFFILYNVLVTAVLMLIWMETEWIFVNLYYFLVFLNNKNKIFMIRDMIRFNSLNDLQYDWQQRRVPKSRSTFAPVSCLCHTPS